MSSSTTSTTPIRTSSGVEDTTTLDETTETVTVEVDATTEDFSKMIGFPLINETL